MDFPDHNRLVAAKLVAAQLVARDGPQFLPVFERLEAEVEASEARDAALARAVELAGREGN